jgi:hypothetical protein
MVFAQRPSMGCAKYLVRGRGQGAASDPSQTRATPGGAVRTGAAVARVLSCVFNVFALNVLWVITSMAIVTIPLTTAAAFGAIDKWLSGADDRVVRNFFARLGECPVLTWVTCGAPLGLVGVAAGEVAFFAARPAAVDRMCLGVAVASCLVAVSIGSYVLFLVSTRALIGKAAWRAAAWMSVRNSVVTGPLFVVEVGAGVLGALMDPGLCVIVVPIAVMVVVYLTARFGLRRTIGFGGA